MMNPIRLNKAFMAGVALFCSLFGIAVDDTFAQVAGGTLDPASIRKFADPLPVPKEMPKERTINDSIDYYEIAARQFKQQILPAGLPKTTVWGYGAADDPSTFSYPARTIEARMNRPVRIKWINDLKDPYTKDYLSHPLPIDQTLHWANPARDCIDAMPGMPGHTDCRGRSQEPYAGPVPIITHLHGAHVQQDSDGYPEAWYLPAADNIPAGYAVRGSKYDQITGASDQPGAATFQYPNTQRSATLWYHDHTLGMTRANVYMGLAGMYLLRNPGNDPSGLPKGQYEVPLVIQDKSFNSDGSLFFPGNRAFFEGLDPADLRIPFIPEPASNGMSDVSPIWNPEFFGNTIVVNGKTWPYLNVEPRRYRFRVLNGSDTRVLILKFDTALSFWQIGADGGFLPKPVEMDQLLIGPAERIDLVVDFTRMPVNSTITLLNLGPDEPFGGGTPGVDFASADPGTTGQVMQFRVKRRMSVDTSTPPRFLSLPKLKKLGAAEATRTLSLNEAESETVPVITLNGQILYRPDDPSAAPFAPVEALLGTATVVNGFITPTPREWMDPITEMPALNATEIWEIYNFTEDAHPIHLHQVQFEVVDRQAIAIDPDTGTAVLVPDSITAPEPGETGTKDTALMYPGQVTRVKARYDLPGLYVWHCHILSHEDNEMMRPICVGGECM